MKIWSERPFQGWTKFVQNLRTKSRILFTVSNVQAPFSKHLAYLAWNFPMPRNSGAYFPKPCLPDFQKSDFTSFYVEWSQIFQIFQVFVLTILETTHRIFFEFHRPSSSLPTFSSFLINEKLEYFRLFNFQKFWTSKTCKDLSTDYKLFFLDCCTKYLVNKNDSNFIFPKM